jgi:hypothetical protein
MSDTPFLVTLDTEGDDLWGRPHQVTTRNAAYVPRFQALCERFGFKPVYLTNFEMAVCDEFVEFGRDALARGACEIGMHLHAWNSPPLVPLTSNDCHFQPYLIEYPDDVMREKIRVMTRLLEERFERPMLSHRAGRWAFDRRYAAMLVEEGYRVDCSVAPDMSWRGIRGAPRGSGGTDYTGFPRQPYWIDPADISKPGRGALLEIPVTVRASLLYRALPWLYRVRLVRRFAHRLSPGLGWLCPAQPALGGPVGRKLEVMLQVARELRRERVTHLEFVMHSSELMPGGSPYFRTASDIERLYEYLEALFEGLSGWCRGMTLAEFHGVFRQAAIEPAGSRASSECPDVVGERGRAHAVLKPSGEIE